MLQPIQGVQTSNDAESPPEDSTHPLSIFVQMAGCSSVPARKAFSNGLIEKLYGTEARQITPLGCYDDGIFGYSFDMEPLRREIMSSESSDPYTPPPAPFPLAHALSKPLQSQPSALLKASLEVLSPKKPRQVNSAGSPHEILRLISNVGIDLFDAGWAQKAADWGVALDFAFPVPEIVSTNQHPRLREEGKRDIGHNLYDTRYVLDFSSFSACFSGEIPEGTATGKAALTTLCTCIACSPSFQQHQIRHSSLDESRDPYETQSPFTRAYIHHLLHTHEMLAHALLVAHNLTVLEGFFRGVRGLLRLHEGREEGITIFEQEIQRFCETYDESLAVFAEARQDWIGVDLARGKGRLSREKERADSEQVDP